MANRNYRGSPLTPVSIYRERLGTWSLWESRGRWECSRGSRLRYPANGQGDGSCLEVLCSPGRPSIDDPSWKCFASLNASPQCTWKEYNVQKNAIGYTMKAQFPILQQEKNLLDWAFWNASENVFWLSLCSDWVENSIHKF